MKWHSWQLPYLALISLLFSACPSKPAEQGTPQEVTKTKSIDGQEYTFTKRIDEKGNLTTDTRDASGNPVTGVPEDAPPKPHLDSELQTWLSTVTDESEVIKVDIALDFEEAAVQERPEFGSAELSEGVVTSTTLDGKEVGDQELKARHEERMARRTEQRAQRIAQRASLLDGWLRKQDILDDKVIEQAVQEGRDALTLELNKAQIEKLISSKDPALSGIELWREGEDDIVQAMADTSISTAALTNATTRGNNIGIYMTESGCANESRITNYDRLAGSETNHSRNVGAIIRTVSPDSFLYCRGGAVLPRSSDLDGVGGNPAIHIVTRSNSNNDNTNYTTLDRNWDNFIYEENVATFNSGGNTGNGTGNVRSPGKGLNIITVGNYNDSNDTIAGNSPFNDPQTGNDKPELAAPGVNITAGGFTMSGTSMSTPHAAAFSADMMSSSTYLQFRPYLVKAKTMAGATDPVSGGYNKVGLGGVDFASAQWSGYWQYYSGNNASFEYFDTNDGNDDGFIEKRIYISSGWNNVRVAIAWLSRGSYTYTNRTAAHPIGMDLDLRVYGPSGNYIGGSYSWDNGFERVNFDPTVTGYYTFKINRYANRDTNCSLRLGMYVNYYD